MMQEAMFLMDPTTQVLALMQLGATMRWSAWAVPALLGCS